MLGEGQRIPPLRSFYTHDRISPDGQNVGQQLYGGSHDGG